MHVYGFSARVFPAGAIYLYCWMRWSNRTVTVEYCLN